MVVDTKTPFELHPGLGAGAVTFGLTPDEVQTLLGPAEQITTNHLKQRVEFRSFLNLGYEPGSSGRLNHMGFGRQMEEVTLHGLNFFRDPPLDVIRKLTALDGQAHTYLGFVVFLRLGIALTGFHDNDVSQKAVSLFPEGAWEKRRDKLKPFSL